MMQLRARSQRCRRRLRSPLLWLAIFYLASAAPAQQATALPTSAQTPATSQAEGSLSGTVTDIDGALVAGAQIVLTSSAQKSKQTVISDSSGQFHFANVSSGAFRLKITAAGLAAGAFTGVMVAGESYDVPPIALPVGATSTEVNVSSMTQQEIAVEQVHREEEQRVIGFVPNYFVTYDRHPAPLRAKQKFGLGWHVIIDPTNFLFAAAAAGIEQEENTFPGYGRGPQGYGKRYGAALANSTSSTLLRGSIYPAIFHQDPRYFYKGTGTLWQRAKYAIATAVICKGDDGRWQPNYSGILGDLTAGALSNAYYPASSRNGAALTFEDGLLSTAGVAAGHLVQEFVFRHLTTHAHAQP